MTAFDNISKYCYISELHYSIAALWYLVTEYIDGLADTKT